MRIIRPVLIAPTLGSHLLQPQRIHLTAIRTPPFPAQPVVERFRDKRAVTCSPFISSSCTRAPAGCALKRNGFTVLLVKIRSLHLTRIMLQPELKPRDLASTPVKCDRPAVNAFTVASPCDSTKAPCGQSANTGATVGFNGYCAPVDCGHTGVWLRRRRLQWRGHASLWCAYPEYISAPAHRSSAKQTGRIYRREI